MAAMRVKRLFKTASRTPSVIFIDEFDSIATKRGMSGSDVGREWNHTLNQLLAEMDGFKKNSKIIVLAATNRVDVLDPAVMRAGRFDRKIIIPLPNYEARCEILRIHGKNKRLSKSVDLEVVARQTSGFSGADLALLLNEAAILAGKEQSNVIKMPHLLGAIDKVLVGDERKGYSIMPEERKVLAYHEAGHAVVASFAPQGDRVQRITILPHGYAGGFTRTSQEKESVILSKTKGLSNVATLLGGRVAEEIVICDISSGAENDLKKANELAREMVEHYGMSEEYGLRYCTQNALGLNESETQKMVDTGMNNILTKAHATATDIITNQRVLLDKIAEKLLEVETLDSNEIENIIKACGVTCG
jgi:cell division protease FtsH